jgi:preprotein translocase subunit SecG
MVVLAMIGLVLLQRSEGGALGIGGGSGAFLSGRGAGNVLTRSTGILAAVFFATSIGLALLARIESGPSDIFDQLPGQAAPAQPGAQQAPLPAGAPASAEDLLRSLGGAGPGPQAPPAGGAEPAAPAAEAPAAPAPAAEAPAAPAPAAAPPAPASPPAPPAPSGAAGPSAPTAPSPPAGPQ